MLTGGCKHPGFSSGYYIAPTVFTDVSLESQIWREEVRSVGLGQYEQVVFRCGTGRRSEAAQGSRLRTAKEGRRAVSTDRQFRA